MRIGRRLIELLQKRTEDGYVQRVDLRLRPSPEVTPIALPVDAAISHYEFERAAMGAGGVHPRACRGRRYRAGPAVSRFDPTVRLAPLARLRSNRGDAADFGTNPRPFRQGATIGPGFDLKRGRGGIREVEFFVQIQQMIHGGRDPSVRAGATLDAIEALLAAGRLDKTMAAELAQAYRLLRTVEHRVQMVDDAQTHLLPASKPRSIMWRGCTDLPAATSFSRRWNRTSNRSDAFSTVSRRTSAAPCRTIPTF